MKNKTRAPKQETRFDFSEEIHGDEYFFLYNVRDNESNVISVHGETVSRARKVERKQNFFKEAA